MATTTVLRQIKEGIANGAALPGDFGVVHGTKPPQPIKPRSLSTHPNRDLRVVVKRAFKINRRTMDPKNSEREFIVHATNAAEAKAFVDEQVAAINEPYLKAMRQRDKRR